MTLFVDLDGVLADFDKKFLEAHGKMFHDYDEEEGWAKLKEIPDFWLNLERMQMLSSFGKV